MRNWFFLLIIIFVAMFQVTFLDFFKVWGVKPDLLFILAFISCLNFKFHETIIFSLSAGVLKDILSPQAMGVNAIAFPLWGFIIIMLSRKISLDNNFFRAAVIFVAIFLNDLILRTIFFSLGNSIPLGIFVRTILLESIYTALIFSWVFNLVETLLGFIKAREELDTESDQESDFESQIE